MLALYYSFRSAFYDFTAWQKEISLWVLLVNIFDYKKYIIFFWLKTTLLAIFICKRVKQQQKNQTLQKITLIELIKEKNIKKWERGLFTGYCGYIIKIIYA